MFERLDEPARHVLQAAWRAAASEGDDAVGTEQLLLALARPDSATARLLDAAGASAADLHRAMGTSRTPPAGRRPDHEALLSTLGIDLAEVRRRAEQGFGAAAIARAAARAKPPRRRRPLRTWISCSTPLPSRRCDSALGGQRLNLTPRVKRVLDRATRDGHPRQASPGHLLLALLAGNEPACEILTRLGVDLDGLATAVRRAVNGGGNASERAG